MPQHDSPHIATRELPNSEFLPFVVERLQEGHTATLPLRGRSMRPFLEDGRDKALLQVATHPQIGDAVLAEIRSRALDIDPMYVVFTSGSTGTPKGVTACHRSVIDYVETLSETLGFSRDTVFGNQTPLYFDACLKELVGSCLNDALRLFQFA